MREHFITKCYDFTLLFRPSSSHKAFFFYNNNNSRRNSHLSLVHFMEGVGSPTELQGRRTSFIQGVVTVPPKDMILAGAV